MTILAQGAWGLWIYLFRFSLDMPPYCLRLQFVGAFGCPSEDLVEILLWPEFAELLFCNHWCAIVNSLCIRTRRGSQGRHAAIHQDFERYCWRLAIILDEELERQARYEIGAWRRVWESSDTDWAMEDHRRLEGPKLGIKSKWSVRFFFKNKGIYIYSDLIQRSLLDQICPKINLGLFGTF